MAHRARGLCGLLALVSTMILLGGCGASTAYPGLYSANYGVASIPTAGRNAAGPDGPVVLGGTDAAFVAELGQPVDQFGGQADAALPASVLAFAHYHDTFVNGVVAVRDIADAARRHQILLVLLSAPPDQPWSRDEAAKYSIAFAPADATPQGTAPVKNAGGQAGEDELYVSAMLASEFPASAFADENGGLVQPGTFNIQCTYPSQAQSNQTLSCQLALGTRQTFDI